jgi:hypothetical protein
VAARADVNNLAHSWRPGHTDVIEALPGPPDHGQTANIRLSVRFPHIGNPDGHGHGSSVTPSSHSESRKMNAWSCMSPTIFSPPAGVAVDNRTGTRPLGAF